jgi:hypothetical protein
VRALDHGFVRAEPERVLEVLRDPAGYPAWWPGARALGDGRVQLPGLPSARLEAFGIRPGTGVRLRVSAGRREAVAGQLEWYLEAFEEGTVVSCIADLRARRSWPPRRVLRMRSGVRAAMVALKGMLE